MRGKTREEIIDILKRFFVEKNKMYDIEMVFLFGSWARGLPKEDSDVDLAVVFKEESASEEELFDSMNDFSLSLSKALGLEVNAIPILPDFPKPMLYYNAIVLGVPIFIENRTRYAKIKFEAIYQMEDFSLFGTQWQLQCARKNLEELNHGRI